MRGLVQKRMRDPSPLKADDAALTSWVVHGIEILRARRWLFEPMPSCTYCHRTVDQLFDERLSVEKAGGAGRFTGKITQDHVVAYAAGGRNSPDNKVPACNFCNVRKSHMPVLTFLLRREEYEADRRKLLNKYKSKAHDAERAEARRRVAPMSPTGVVAEPKPKPKPTKRTKAKRVRRTRFRRAPESTRREALRQRVEKMMRETVWGTSAPPSATQSATQSATPSATLPTAEAESRVSAPPSLASTSSGLPPGRDAAPDAAAGPPLSIPDLVSDLVLDWRPESD